MATTSHLDQLNPAQRKAVTHGAALAEQGYTSGPLLIVAGAGTGKTDTLAHRVAHLVINGVSPGRILMLTFTRRAATESRRTHHMRNHPSHRCPDTASDRLVSGDSTVGK